MSHRETISQIMRDKQLASLGDAYINLVYSLALTQIKGQPHGTKVSDRALAEAFKQAGLRDYLGSRVAKKEFANAAESLLAEAFRREVLTIGDSVRILCEYSEDINIGLSDLLKSAVQRLDRNWPASRDC